MKDNDRAELARAEAVLFERLGLERREHRVRVPELGADVRVIEVGRGESTLCIHGSPNAASTWAQLVAAMPERRFLLLDRPGSGLSDPVVWKNHRAETVAVMRSVLDALNVERVDVIGSSLGGIYAYYLAIDAPARVRTVVQMGAPGAGPGVGMPFVFRLMCLPGAVSVMRGIFKPTLEGARAGWRELGHARALDSGTIPEDLFAWYAALCADGATFHGTVSEVRSFATPFGYRPGVVPTQEELAGIDRPLLYVWGAHDNFEPPATGDALAAMTRGAELRLLPEGGHLPWCDDPALVASWLRAFFRKEARG